MKRIILAILLVLRDVALVTLLFFIGKGVVDWLVQADHFLLAVYAVLALIVLFFLWDSFKAHYNDLNDKPEAAKDDDDDWPSDGHFA